MRAFWRQMRLILDMIKFEHTIFALPFALIGAILAAGRNWPSAREIGWILVAMVGARSAAMSFNRLVDAPFDAQNPRTARRHIPAGLLSRTQVWTFFIVAAGLFFLAAWQLSPICLWLAPIALLVTCGYSYTKRFTSLCHLFLGLAIGIAPVGAWIAIRGTLEPAPLLLGAAVMLWIGGFDIIYALQDYEFDLRSPLHSLPKRLGKAGALRISRAMHAVMLLLLIAVGVLQGLHALYFLGVAVVAALIAYEQSLVRPDDLSRVDLAFFTLNGWVSVSLFAFVLLDRVVLH